MTLAKTYNYEQAIRLLEEGKYSLTKEGVLTNVAKDRRIGTIGTHGYWQAGLWCNVKKECYQILIHRLVFCYFKGMIASDVEIDHKDNDRSNPALVNLQKMTHQGNMDKMNRQGRQKSARGDDHSSSKIPDRDAKIVRYLWMLRVPVERIAELYGVKYWTIKRIIKGHRYIDGVQLEDISQMHRDRSRRFRYNRALAMKDRYETSDLSMAKVAAEFGVAAPAVHMAVHGRGGKIRKHRS